MGVNNSASTITRMAAMAEQGDINATIHVGDVSYADDSKIVIEPSSGRGYEAIYDLFQASIEPVSAFAPYMVAPGNHDVSCHVTGDLGCPQQQRNFTAFRRRFVMPSRASGAVDEAGRSVENMWYSFEVAGIHFVSVSTESDYHKAPTSPDTFVGGGKGGGFGDQLGWLKRDLDKARASKTVRFIVVYGHRPWYASSTSDWPLLTPTHAQAAFEPLFREFRVDLYVCGHKHYYERTVPAYRGERDDRDGTVTVINGAAGNNEGIEKKGKGSDALIVAANYAEEGFGVLDLQNATALRFRYILSASGDVADEFTLNSRYSY
jgi:3',5'-cyclic AMP phosphodiesterase CpdA